MRRCHFINPYNQLGCLDEGKGQCQTCGGWFCYRHFRMYATMLPATEGMWYQACLSCREQIEQGTASPWSYQGEEGAS